MNICSENHPEICYDQRICPLCDEKDDRANEVEELEKAIKSLNNEIERLQND